MIQNPKPPYGFGHDKCSFCKLKQADTEKKAHVTGEEICHAGDVYLLEHPYHSVPYSMTPAYFNSFIAELYGWGFDIVRRK